MTLFWHGHFTSATGKVFSFTQGFYQQNETYRRHAMGNFREFLEAVTLDPAMMAYLDLERSNKATSTTSAPTIARSTQRLWTAGQPVMRRKRLTTEEKRT